MPIKSWPRLAGVHWLVPASWRAKSPDVNSFEKLCWPFTDVLASGDAVIGKPGYGTFTEAACHGMPMLYVRRADDWPEEPYLIEWLERNARAAGDPATSGRGAGERLPRAPACAKRARRNNLE